MTNVNTFFPSRWLEAADIGDADQVATIQRVDVEELQNRDGKRDRRPVLYFQGIEKGLILNRTNANQIAFMYGEEVEGWAGKTITLGTAWVEAFGEQKLAIRVRPGLPGGATTGAPIPQQPQQVQQTVQQTANAMQAPQGPAWPGPQANQTDPLDDDIPY